LPSSNSIDLSFPRKGGQGAENLRKKNRHVHPFGGSSTNAFSKKFENFRAAVALNFTYYNFVKTHGTIRMTPAQAAGVENSAWTVTELVERCGE
jgi:hypothetical protein